jgi:phosphoglycerate dehydrogenase-like enzyme
VSAFHPVVAGVSLWIPDLPGWEAIGELPPSVKSHVYAHDQALPAQALSADFLVARRATAGLVALLPKMKRLRVLQALSSGAESLPESAPRKVQICTARGTRDEAVSEWIIGAILASIKLFAELRDQQHTRRGAWSEPDDLAGKTVMILGYGSIGAALEGRLAPFDVKVIRVARRARPRVHSVEKLAELLSLADVLVVLLPLTTSTDHLLDGEMLDRLRPGALVVNASPGAVIDTDALLDMLQVERLRAVVDATDPEPLPRDHPLWRAPGVLITPHVAGDSPAANRRAFTFVGEQVRRYVNGEALVNLVTEGV